MKNAPSNAAQISLASEPGSVQDLNPPLPAEAEERKRVEEAIKTNEALLRLFIKHTPAAIAMLDTSSPGGGAKCQVMNVVAPEASLSFSSSSSLC